MEGAGGRCQGRSVDARGGSRVLVGRRIQLDALSPGRDRAVGPIVEARGAAVEGGHPSRDRRIVAFPDVERIPGQVAAHDRDVGLAVVEVLASVKIEGIFLHSPFVVPHGGLDREAFEVVAQDVVDDAGHRVGAVKRRSAVRENLDPTQAECRDGVGVDRLNWHIAFDLRTGVRHQSPAVQQYKRIARADRTQIDRRHIAPRIVDPAVVAVRLIETDVAHLCDGAVKIVAVCGADRIQIRLVDDGDRQGFVYACPPDPATDDHDLFDLGCASVAGRSLLQDNGRSLVRGDVEVGAFKQAAERVFDVHLPRDGGSDAAREVAGGR